MSDFDNSGVTEPQTTTPAEPAPQQTNVPPYQPAPEKPKKRFPKVLLIVAALLVIGAAAFFGIRAIAGGKPINKAALSMKKAVEAMEKNNNYAVLKSVGEAGSVNISVDLSKLGEVLPGGMELPVMINATSYTDAKNGKAALELDAQIKNKSIVNGTVLVSEDQLAVACDALLGKTPYSLDLKNIAKNLPKSFLDPNSDSDSALPEEVYDWLVSLKNGPIAPAKELVKQLKPIGESAAKVLLDSLNKNAEVSKENETISISDKDVKTTAITITLDGKQTAAVVTDLLKWAKADKNLKSFFDGIVKNYGPLLENEYQSAEDFVDEFYESIDDGLDEMADIDKDDFDITCVCYINKSNGQLVKAELTLKNDDGRQVLSFEGGPDWKNPTYIAYSVKDSYSKQSFTYTVEEDTKEQFSAKIKVKDDRDTTMTASLSWDKTSGDIRLTSSDINFKLTGTLTQKNKVTTITLKKLEYSYMTVKDLGTTITLNESAKLPTIAKTTEILSLDEDGLQALLEDISDAVMDLRDAIEDAMY